MTTAIKHYATNGYIGTDIETGTTNNGSEYARFRLAKTARVRDESGNWVDGDTTWYTCTAWDSLAGKIAANFGKGNGVLVFGTLTHSSYVNNDGQAVTVPQIRLDDMGASVRMFKMEGEQPETANEDQPPF